MQNIIKEQILGRVNVQALTQFIGLAGIALFLPFFIHLQWISGPIINAILILILFLSGIRAAMVVALIPSLMALSGGLLPAVLAPVVPFIMISNMIFVLTIDWFYSKTKDSNKGYWLGVIMAAVVKFAFLYFSVSWITKLLIKQELAVKVAQMMSWPQFATAIIGGMIAWVILKWLKRF
jgi:riboflavin transporter